MITKLDIQNFTISPGNPLFWGQRVKDQVHKSQKQCRRGSLHSCECWLLLVTLLFQQMTMKKPINIAGYRHVVAHVACIYEQVGLLPERRQDGTACTLDAAGSVS